MKAFVLVFKDRYAFLATFIFFTFLIYNYNYKIDHSDASFNSTRGTDCDFKTNILFLKTHKTASSSVQNVFLRFAEKYQRLVAIQNIDRRKFQKSSLFDLKPGYNYSIFAEHTIFDYEEMRAVMPDDTKYITILRDPVTQFESLFRYEFMETLYGMNVSEVANLNTSDDKWQKVKDERASGHLGRNQMAFDLGIDPRLFDDEDAISEKVRELDRQFDLVMIAELFDQSLILMKEHLCWKDSTDVIGFQINARKAESRTRLSSEQKENLRRMNRADQMIYDHFYEKLLRQIDAFGKEKMDEEVERLRVLTKMMYTFCIDTEASDESNGSSALLVLKREAEMEKVCQDLIKDDYSYTLDIFAKQKQFYTDSEQMLALFENFLKTFYFNFKQKFIH